MGSLSIAESLTDEETADKLLTPSNTVVGKGQRYYQEIAINRVLKALLQGKKRILLTMATGTGKTAVAFSNLLEALEHALEPRR